MFTGSGNGETLSVDIREERTSVGQSCPSGRRRRSGSGILGWLVLVALALGLGALVTNFVVGHSLGHGDLDIARWFADRRTATWNSLSKVGSYFAETVTVFVVIAIALVVLAIQAGLAAVRAAWPSPWRPRAACT